MNIAAKVNASIAKSLAVIGGVIVLAAVMLRLYAAVFYLPELRFYKNVPDCSLRVYTVFENEIKRKCVFIDNNDCNVHEKLYVNSEYCSYLMKYNRKNNVDVSLFKTYGNKTFATFDFRCSEKEAAKQYKQFYPPRKLELAGNIVFGIGCSIVTMGLVALGISRRYNDPDETYIPTQKEQELSKELSQQFDNELSKSPYSYRKAPRRGPSQISESEKEQLLHQFDEMTENQRYKYSAPFEPHIRTPEEIEADKALAREFDSVVSKDPYRYSRVIPDDMKEQEKTADMITMDDRDDLLEQYEKLTEDGKYNYKTHE